LPAVDLQGRQPFPETPDCFRPVDSELVRALAEAGKTAARHGGRPALERILLRGKTGAVVGTDGRQLLSWGGFDFPWQEELLLPNLGVWCCRELPRHLPPALVHSEGQVFVRLGPITVALAVDTHSRYPDVESVLPREKDVRCRLRLNPTSVGLLSRGLPGLPGADERLAPVLLELGHTVTVRGQTEAGPSGAVTLPEAEVEGPPLRVGMDRRYLLRALRLGFTEVLLSGPDRPLLCRDDRRRYLWMPVDVHPPAMPTAVTANGQAGISPPVPPGRQSPKEKPMPPSSEEQPVPGPEPDVLAEAEALRELVQQAQCRLLRLLSALKRQKRRERVLQAAVSALR
jgi:hypothetical protein